VSSWQSSWPEETRNSSKLNNINFKQDRQALLKTKYCPWVAAVALWAVTNWCHLANDISWIHTNCFEQYHARKKQKTHATLTFDLWPWYLIGLQRLSRYMFTQSFVKLSATVHESLCWHSFHNAENDCFRGQCKWKWYVRLIIKCDFTGKKSGVL